tara:strand:+ start:26 stop:568 length:543 start_codon:yes stop_codon:yes gene_type:complete
MTERLKRGKDFFITSDTWFGRPQILQIANRLQFKDIDEMNQVLIKNWNSKVKKNDTVFHLGNFAWDPQTARQVLRKLNGVIYFVIGTADEALLDIEAEFDNISILEDQIIDLPQFDSVISHYPLEVWNGKDTGTIHFHGHTVYSHKTDLDMMNRVNVCTDFWSYTPVKYSTIKDFIDGKN